MSFEVSQMALELPEECFHCYFVCDQDPGIFTCLSCADQAGLCLAHALTHLADTGHELYVQVTPGSHSLCRLDASGSITTLDPSTNCEYGSLYSDRELITYPSDIWKPLADEDSLRRSWVAGFYNLGYTCYTNSTLQVMLAIREFSEFCLTSACSQSGPLGFEFNRLLSALSTGNSLSLVNGRLRKQIALDSPDYLNTAPQDSVDYFHYLTATIRKYIPGAPLSLSEFDLRTDTKCQSCGKTVSSLENAVKLITIEPAELGKSTQLDDIDDMSAPPVSVINLDWDCPDCHRRKANVCKQIVSAPKYLFVVNALDIGSRDPDCRYKRDLKLALDPDCLCLSSFVESGEAVYELLAFTHHQGRWSKYGHDISYVRHDGVWVEHNDAVMRKVEDIKKHVVFGKQYLYLYRLKGGE
jgi:uncharacterized UBP type Zn finger protein